MLLPPTTSIVWASVAVKSGIGLKDRNCGGGGGSGVSAWRNDAVRAVVEDDNEDEFIPIYQYGVYCGKLLRWRREVKMGQGLRRSEVLGSIILTVD